MNLRILQVVLVFCITRSIGPAFADVPATQPSDLDRASPSIATPKHDPKTAKRFLRLHEQYVQQAKVGDIDLLFLGASIVEGWNKVPELWDKHYKPLKAANFGISGDRIQHVLWRVQNGELDGSSPRVIVLMIGTNNSNSDDADAIVKGMKTLLAEIQGRSPESRVLLLGILPRNKPTDDRQLGVIREANSQLPSLDDGERVRFLDMTAKFLKPDGSVNGDLFRDGIHPNAAGYQVWIDAMQPLLDEMLEKGREAEKK